MDLLAALFDLILQVDRHLSAFVLSDGSCVYTLRFLIIFVETERALMPFLPADSRLFGDGALGGLGLKSLPLTMRLLTTAAVSGNQTSDATDRRVGARVFCWSRSRLFNRAASATFVAAAVGDVRRLEIARRGSLKACEADAGAQAQGQAAITCATAAVSFLP